MDLPDLSSVPGPVSVWCGPVGCATPLFARAEHVPHYAASTMKLAVLAAVYASGLDLGTPIGVTHRFRSALAGAPEYVMRPEPDVAGVRTLGWLAERMIVRSSNLATNLILERLGIVAVQGIWARVGARHSVVARGIDDAAARAAGITNTVTAADLALLLAAIATERLPGARPMLATLERTGHRDDLAAGLPAGTRVAHKSGWVTGVRHGAGIVYPRARDPYLLVALSTTRLPDAAARRLLARIAAASWRELGE